ncbi:MAG: hypothetical protein ACRDT8_20535, partial [Micromonosporaceae bacterium]
VPQELRKIFSLAAAGAALLDLISVAVLAVQVSSYADKASSLSVDVSYGAGWYLGLLGAILLCAAAVTLAVTLFAKQSPPQGGQPFPGSPDAYPGSPAAPQAFPGSPAAPQYGTPYGQPSAPPFPQQPGPQQASPPYAQQPGQPHQWG